MIDKNESKLITALLDELADFFLQQACVFLQENPAFGKLPKSQISGLRQAFEREAAGSSEQQERLNVFIKKQCEKEERRRTQKFWRALLYDGSAESNRLSQFLFNPTEVFMDALQKQAHSTLAVLAGDKSPTKQLENLLTRYLSRYGKKEIDKNNALREINDWQNATLKPMITKKLFYTLLSLHRLQQFQEKREVPCTPSTH